MFVLFFSSCATSQSSKTTRKTNKDRDKATNTYVIRYDFHTKTYDTNNVRPRINQPVIFKVVNINRFAYDVVVTSRDSMLVIAESAEVKEPGARQEEPPPSEVGLADAAVPQISNADAQGTIAERANTANSWDSLLKQVRLESSRNILEKSAYEKSLRLFYLSNDSMNYEMQIRSLRGVGVLSDSANAARQQLTLSLDEARRMMHDIRTDLDRNNRELQVIQDQLRVINIHNEIVRNYANRLVDLRSSYSDLLKGYRNAWEVFRKYNQLLSIASQPLLSPPEFRKSCVDSSLLLNDQAISRYRIYISEFFNKLADFYLQYETIMNDYEITRILNDEGRRKLQASSKALKNSADRMAQVVRDRKPGEVIDKIVHIYSTMLKDDAYEIASAPIQPSQDLVVFDISIKHKYTKEYRDDRAFSYREYVRGGLRYDFSTGLVIGFGINDRTYHTIDTDADSVRIVSNSRSNRYMPSIAAMLHASFRSWRQVNVGFTLGASISTSELDINSLYPGISLMIGKGEKIIITGGPALKKINYLDSKYLEGNVYASSEFPQGVPVVSTFRFGWFAGISYNLTQKQRSNFKL